jgi:energy-coupling factor transport system permease protein
LQPNSKGLRHVGRCVSIVITWALENALDTADSMRGRGYGLRPRSYFTIYRFTLHDGLALSALLPLCLCSAAAAMVGWADWSYYPVISGGGGIQLGLAALSYGLLALYPLILEGKEALAWRASS